jgi:hypothetical protein
MPKIEDSGIDSFEFSPESGLDGSCSEGPDYSDTILGDQEIKSDLDIPSISMNRLRRLQLVQGSQIQ